MINYYLTITITIDWFLFQYDSFWAVIIKAGVRRWPGRWSKSLGVNKRRWKVIAMEFVLVVCDGCTCYCVERCQFKWRKWLMGRMAMILCCQKCGGMMYCHGRSSRSCGIMVEFDNYVWSYAVWSYARVRAIFYTVMHVNKTRMMNKNLNPFFRRFLVFEMWLLIICYCNSLFS